MINQEWDKGDDVSQESSDSKVINTRMKEAAQRLIEQVPNIGVLQLRFFYDHWQLLVEEFSLAGYSLVEAQLMAWGTLTEFANLRTSFLEVILQDESSESHKEAVNDYKVLLLWHQMQLLHYDEAQRRFVGAPFFDTDTNFLPLNDYSAEALVDSLNPLSPTFGQLQLLDRAARSLDISGELEDAVLASKKESSSAEHVELLGKNIHEWRHYSSMEMPAEHERFRQGFLLATYAVLFQLITDQHEDEELSDQFEMLLEFYMSLFAVTSQDSFALVLGVQPPEIYTVPEVDLNESTLIPPIYRGKEVEETSGFALQVANYLGIDIVLILSWNADKKTWTGNGGTSSSKDSTAVFDFREVDLLGANSPVQAADGFLAYFRNNVDAFQAPRGMFLSDEEKMIVLERLKHGRIIKCDENFANNAHILREPQKLMRFLLGEIEFESIPPFFAIAVHDLRTRNVHMALCQKESKDVRFLVVSAENALEGWLEKALDFVNSPFGHGILVCSNSLCDQVIAAANPADVSRQKRMVRTFASPPSRELGTTPERAKVLMVNIKATSFGNKITLIPGKALH
jgi:hypothetical protein